MNNPGEALGVTPKLEKQNKKIKQNKTETWIAVLIVLEETGQNKADKSYGLKLATMEEREGQEEGEGHCEALLHQLAIIVPHIILFH